MGNIVYKQWNWLQAQYPYVVLHSLAVMPDHIHGIIEINDEFTDDKNNIQGSRDATAYPASNSYKLNVEENTNLFIPSGGRDLRMVVEN